MRNSRIKHDPLHDMVPRSWLLLLAFLLSVAQARLLGGSDNEKGTSSRNLQTTTTGNRLIRVANGSPASAYPLKKCQGDCDRNADCATGLVCFQRNTGDKRSIPGCIGAPLSDSTDYCYDPNAAVAATIAPKATPVSPPVRFAPKQPLATPIAKAPARPVPVAKPPIPQLPSPPSKGQLQDMGIDWRPRNAYPLGLCQGDCDGDSDCLGDLVCYQRDASDLVVPSCSGRPSVNTDYCIRPEDETARPPAAGAFRLKLYWEFGYDWQEEFWEQEWCMECDGNTCEDNDALFLRTCVDDNTWFVYQPVAVNAAAATTGSVAGASTAVVQFKIVTSANLCLEWVEARDIRARTCNATARRQHFTALNGVFGPGQKFEISTAMRQGCLSQHHHPKDGEKIFRANCTRFRDLDTSYWTHY